MSLSGSLTVDRVAEAVQALEFAISEIGKTGVHIADQSRLQQHLSVLRPLVAATSFPGDPVAQASIAAALGDAVQFSLVASVLPEQNVATLLTDITQSLNGSQTRREAETGEPYRFQSQLYFGSMLAAAGHRIQVPSGEGMPDFVAPNGTLTHGIEVKRPAGLRIRRALSKAADQVGRTGGRGLVVVDLSDVLSTHSARIVESLRGPDLWRAQFEQAFREEVDHVSEILRPPGSSAPRPRFTSLAAYCLFATGWVWVTSSDDPAGWPEYRAIFHARRMYPDGVHGLTFHRGTWLRDIILSSLERFVGSVEVKEVE